MALSQSQYYHHIQLKNYCIFVYYTEVYELKVAVCYVALVVSVTNCFSSSDNDEFIIEYWRWS